MKTCTKCNIEKPKNQFSKHAGTMDKLQPECKDCNRDRRIIYADKIAAYRREHYRVNFEKISIAQRAYRIIRSDKIAEQKRQYYKDNIERFSERNRAYRENNPEKRAAHNRNYRSRVRSADGKHTADDVATIFEGQRGLCANCSARLVKSGKKKYHVDHIMPLALGGSNWPSNLQCLCQPCNQSKYSKDPIEWANENGRLI